MVVVVAVAVVDMFSLWDFDERGVEEGQTPRSNPVLFFKDDFGFWLWWRLGERGWLLFGDGGKDCGGSAAETGERYRDFTVRDFSSRGLSEIVMV